LGSLPIAQVLLDVPPYETVVPTASEADMQHTATNRHHGTRDSVAAAFLLLAGIIVMIASGDALALLIAAVVIVTLVWGMIRGIQDRVRNRAELARVTHLRPASTGQRELKRTPAHASWRGPSAA
jgi:Flp pilus assembly protein TadB